jgi:methionine-rich copper-binding protein CopC
MRRSRLHLVLLGTMMALSCLLLACSDSSDPVGPGGSNGDTTAPLVVSITPANNSTGVALDAAVTVTFSKDMDQTSHAGQVSLSSGTIASLAWTSPRVLTVTHEGWAEGTAVTVTLGTGLRDADGNSLASPYTATFYTLATELVFLASEPADGALDVNRSTRIELLFSARMDEQSVAAHLTLQDAAQVDLPYTLSGGSGDWLIVDPEDPLPASATITLTVAAGAADLGGRELPSPVTISFTTSDEIDTTPPTIESIVPASGSTIPTSTATIVITFSEPMDTDSIVPVEMGAEFWALITSQGIEPSWSQNNTVLTVSLPAPLPAGVPLWVVFAGYRDANGVVQPDATHWSVTVAGSPDYYPLIDGREVEYFEVYSEGEVGDDDPVDQGNYSFYVRYEDQGGGIFHRIDIDPDTEQIHSWDIVSRPAGGLLVHGFHEVDDDETVLFTTPVTFLQFPPSAGATWNQSVGVQGDATFEVTTAGQWVEQLERMPVGPAKNGMQIYWTDVWVATLSYTLGADGTVFQSGTDTTYLAPGFGMVRVHNDEIDHADEYWKTRERWLVLPSVD